LAQTSAPPQHFSNTLHDPIPSAKRPFGCVARAMTSVRMMRPRLSRSWVTVLISRFTPKAKLSLRQADFFLNAFPAIVW
jgi:hypothetical protein